MPTPSNPEPALRPGPKERAAIAADLMENIRSSLTEVERLVKDCGDLAEQGEFHDAYCQLVYAKARQRNLEYYITRMHYLDHDIRVDS